MELNSELRSRESGILSSYFKRNSRGDNDSLGAIDYFTAKLNWGNINVRANTKLPFSQNSGSYTGDKAISGIEVDPTEARYLLSSAKDGTVAIYDIRSPENEFDCIASVEGHSLPNSHSRINSIQWFPYDTGMFFTCGGSFVHVWDTNQLETVLSFDFKKLDLNISSISKYNSSRSRISNSFYGGESMQCESPEVHQIHMSSCGSSPALIAACNSNSKNIRLLDIRSGAFTHSLSGHLQEIWTLQWSLVNEWTLASGGKDKQIRFWDIRRPGSFMLLDQYNDHEPFLQPSIFEAANKSSQLAVESHSGPVTHLQFTLDGWYLLSLGTDKKIRKWDVFTGNNTMVPYQTMKSSQRTTKNFKCVQYQRFSHFSTSRGDILAFPAGSDIKILEGSTLGKEIKVLKTHHFQVTHFARDPTFEILYSGDTNGHLYSWDPNTLIKSREETFSGDLHEDNISDEEQWSE